MKYNTEFSYGTYNIDFKNTNDAVLDNFFNDINNFNIKYIDVSPTYSNELYENEKNVGKIIRGNKNLKTSFKFITKLYLLRGLPLGDAIDLSINKSISSLGVQYIDILKIDFKDVSLEYSELCIKLVELKNKGIVKEIAFSNVDINKFYIIRDYFSKYNLTIDYLYYHLNYLEGYSFLNENYQYINLLETKLLLDVEVSDGVNNNFLDTVIQKTGYSNLEFFIIYVNSLNLNKIVNISTSKMKIYLQIKNLSERRLTTEQLKEFAAVIKEVYENN